MRENAQKSCRWRPDASSGNIIITGLFTVTSGNARSDESGVRCFNFKRKKLKKIKKYKKKTIMIFFFCLFAFFFSLKI